MNTKARKYIPLTEATYYILLSLVKPMHGYGIMQMVEEMTNGEVKLIMELYTGIRRSY